MESRDLMFDMSPAERRLAEAREVANDPTAPYEVWRKAYLLVQDHDIWGWGVSRCVTSTPADDSAERTPSS